MQRLLSRIKDTRRTSSPKIHRIPSAGGGLPLYDNKDSPGSQPLPVGVLVYCNAQQPTGTQSDWRTLPLLLLRLLLRLHSTSLHFHVALSLETLDRYSQVVAMSKRIMGSLLRTLWLVQ